MQLWHKVSWETWATGCTFCFLSHISASEKYLAWKSPFLPHAKWALLNWELRCGGHWGRGYSLSRWRNQFEMIWALLIYGRCLKILAFMCSLWVNCLLMNTEIHTQPINLQRYQVHSCSSVVCHSTGAHHRWGAGAYRDRMTNFQIWRDMLYKPQTPLGFSLCCFQETSEYRCKRMNVQRSEWAKRFKKRA